MKIVKSLLKTQRNNRYMLVVIDYYTRCPAAFAFEHLYAYSVAIRLISKIISCYKSLYVIQAD